MNICLYSETVLPKVGGQELVVDQLARELVRQGHEVTVLAPRPRRPLRPQDAALPYRVVRHPRFFSTVHFVSWYTRFLRQAHRTFKFDVVHCHGVYPTAWLASLCKIELEKTGTPVVVTSHGGDVRAGNARLRKPALVPRHRDALAAADACVAISAFTADGFKRLCPTVRRIEHIPNGVDVKRWATPVIDRPKAIASSVPAGRYVLFIGRLHARKGADVLIEAARACTELPVVVAGAGAERDNLEALVRRAGMTGRVTFTDAVDGAAKAWLLQNALAVVLPSRGWEAFPLVALEAWAAGKAVIGSNIPGLSDLIRPGDNGWLFESESASALAEILQMLSTHPDVAGAIGEKNRAGIDAFDWSNVARRHVELYKELRREKLKHSGVFT